MNNLKETGVYLSRSKYDYYQNQLDHMEKDVSMKLAKELGKSPGSGMGRPLDLPIHNFARRFYAEIDSIRYKINNAIVIDDLEKPEDPIRVFLGATVHLKDIDYCDIFSYLILGSDEADPPNGKISYQSPLGSELLGKSPGDSISLSNGVKYSIIKIEYKPLDFNYTITDWNKILSANVK
jgi:hypothetical protein